MTNAQTCITALSLTSTAVMGCYAFCPSMLNDVVSMAICIGLYVVFVHNKENKPNKSMPIKKEASAVRCISHDDVTTTNKSLKEYVEELEQMMASKDLNVYHFVKVVRIVAGLMPRALENQEQYKDLFMRVYQQIMALDSVIPSGCFIISGAFGHVRVLDSAQWRLLKIHLNMMSEKNC